MLGNMSKIIGQMQGLQETLKSLTVEGNGGNGVVKVIMNGQQNILAVRFNPDLVGQIDPIELGQMIIEAYNTAQSNSKEKAKEEVSKITGLNLANLPGLF
ncbi:hypothetical protein N752_04755 [Desulforamulus aquiferis]|nr:hypothetical protein N752_04755 [Desulforamulus aquiferis]